MKKYKYILAAALCLGTLSSCHDLDIMPKDVMTNEDIFTDAGVDSYFAALYSRLPMEDFNVSAAGGDHQGFFYWNCMSWDMLLTGENVNRNNTGFDFNVPVKGYWSDGYSVIRQCNAFIKNLETYKNQFSLTYDFEAAEAEARFLRAYTYFALTKRYGGVPVLTEAQELQSDESKLWMARSSHKECVDFILEDLDYAIAHLGTKKVAGRANKYVAAAIKSRVALYAGSVARYGGQFDYTVDGVQVCGIPASDANGYFKQAYDAAKTVEEGGYQLYEKDADKAENFRKVFADADNSDESVFVRQYSLTNNVHSFDAMYGPYRMVKDGGGRYDVTLDWVELFDGLPLDSATGHLKTTDANGKYIVYNDEKELFKNVEPRLRGSLMMPGETYKGVTLDIRSGLIKEDVDPATAKIDKFVADDGQTTTVWKNNQWFKNNVLTTTDKFDAENAHYTLADGSKININGKDGTANGSSDKGTLTGFHGVKWLDLNLSISGADTHRSTQTWIDVRYAEILLNRAEAAIELAQNGEPNYDNVDMLQDAMTCINKIRERAGATLLQSTVELANTPITNERGTGINSFVFAPNVGLHVVRVERYKELAFEHKLYWDLRRWFTFDTQIKQYRRRMLAPFMFIKGAILNRETGNPEGKYIYDTRVCERASASGSFPTKNYYDKIPDGERTKNPLLVQNDQY